MHVMLASQFTHTENNGSCFTDLSPFEDRICCSMLMPCIITKEI